MSSTKNPALVLMELHEERFGPMDPELRKRFQSLIDYLDEEIEMEDVGDRTYTNEDATLRAIVKVLHPEWNEHRQPVGFDEARRILEVVRAAPQDQAQYRTAKEEEAGDRIRHAKRYGGDPEDYDPVPNHRGHGTG